MFEVLVGRTCMPRTMSLSAVEAYLKASNTGANDYFGFSVALSGDGSTLAVGAHYEAGSGTGVNPPSDEGATESGAVYVYRRTGTTWAFEAYLKASNAGAGDGFGWSLALSGDGSTLAVGARLEDGTGTGVNPPSSEGAEDSGAVYVYRRTGMAWAFEAYLKASNTGGDDHYGTSVALSADGSTLAVGAWWEDGSGTGVNPPSDEGARHSGAVYVYRRTGTTWAFEAYLKASNAGAEDSFGESLALSGDGNTLAVGAPQEDGSGSGVNPPADEGTRHSGAVYVYRRTGTAWAFEAYLKASNAGAEDWFGQSVALSADGSTLAVGAPQEDGTGTGVNPPSDEGAYASGAVYVYRRTGTTWAFEAYLKASNTGAVDTFGTSVALSGDGSTLAVGARLEAGTGTGVNPPSSEGAEDSGAVYVYRRTGMAWAFEAYLKASNTGGDDHYGTSVALSADGSTLAVGAWWEDGSGTGVNPPSDEGARHSGAVYVYRRTGTTWAFEAYLKASNTGAVDTFGTSVALSGDGSTLAVGARLEDGTGTGVNPPSSEGAEDSGAVYVYRRTGMAWAFEAYLKASNTGGDDHYGTSVALSADGSTLAVGAWWEDGSGTGVNPPSDEGARHSGAVYVYRRTGTTWAFEAYLKASNAGAEDSFGESLALSGDGNTLAVGAPQEDGSGSGVNPPSDEGAYASGAVYVYRRTGTAWAFEAYLKASNAGAEDWFGQSVALSGDGSTLAVGAPQEDGTGTGVNPPSDEGAYASGAVYVYRRTGTTWAFEAYLKASNTGAVDTFGTSVALSGEGSVLAVGAPYEAGSGTGVNPPSDEGAGDSGAVYVYRRTGTAWAFEAYLKASNTGAVDTFGTSVALSGDGSTLAVGAWWEDGSGTGVNPPSDERARDSGAVYVYR